MIASVVDPCWLDRSAVVVVDARLYPTADRAGRHSTRVTWSQYCMTERPVETGPDPSAS